MSTHRLDRLLALAAMQRDIDLAKLGQLAEARAETRARLEDLRRSASAPVATDPVLMGVRQRHRLWADAQRAELNITLARQEAAWLEARDHTRRSFGRAAVLERLAERQREADNKR